VLHEADPHLVEAQKLVGASADPKHPDDRNLGYAKANRTIVGMAFLALEMVEPSVPALIQRPPPALPIQTA